MCPSHKIELGSPDALENRCLSLLLKISEIKDNEVEIVCNDSSPASVVVSAKTNSSIAAGLVEIVYWLSFRRFYSSPSMIQSLCGSCQASKREVGRALKRILHGSEAWADLLTHVREQLQDPLCSVLLLNKMIQHRKLHYMTGKSNNCVTQHLTIADILMTMMLSPWLHAFERDKDYLIETIPSLVDYIQRMRCEIIGLNAEIDKCIYLEFMGPCWVDDCAQAISPLRADTVVNFAQCGHQKKVAKQSSANNAPADLTDTTAMEAAAASLVARVHWQLDGAEEVEEESSTDAALYAPACKLWRHMCLPPGREARKQQQVASLLRHALALLPPGGVAVEFCSGGGYVGVPLAHLRPDCTVLLTDMNAVSLQFARQRVQALGLSNVRFLRAELAGVALMLDKTDEPREGCEDWDGSSEDGKVAVSSEAEALLRRFELGISLHACGGATDAVLELCRRRGAASVVSPCCYGFLQHYGGSGAWAEETETAASAGSVESAEGAATSECSDDCSGNYIGEAPCSMGTPRTYPQSKAFRAQGWRVRWFSALCRRADRTFWAHDARAERHNAEGARAMRLVDADRLLVMQEAGYEARGALMRPLEASVKNHILIARKV